jgi:hypothetical protein
MYIQIIYKTKERELKMKEERELKMKEERELKMKEERELKMKEEKPSKSLIFRFKPSTVELLIELSHEFDISRSAIISIALKLLKERRSL